MTTLPPTPSPLRHQIHTRVVLCTALTAAALLTLSFSMTATAQAQVQSLTCPNPYTVQSHDNLAKLAAADGVSIQTLQAINGIINPNVIFVGQVLCLPNPLPTATPVPSATPIATATDVGTVTAIPATPTAISTDFMPTVIAIPATVMPAATPIVYPSIAFDRGLAIVGETITVTGINFPPSATVQVFYKPLTSADAYAPIGQTIASPTGTINFALVVPTTYENNSLLGAVSVLVRDPVSGYYGYSFFYARATTAS